MRDLYPLPARANMFYLSLVLACVKNERMKIGFEVLPFLFDVHGSHPLVSLHRLYPAILGSGARGGGSIRRRRSGYKYYRRRGCKVCRMINHETGTT